MEEEMGGTKNEAEKKVSAKGFILEIFQYTLVSLAIVLPVRYFLIQPFLVSGSSMDPTFQNGEYLVVDEISYRFNPPERGDVIIFKYPLDQKKRFIKRVIGLPGETIEVGHGDIFVSSSTASNFSKTKLDEPYVENKLLENYGPITLMDNQYFVMGDNRIASADSRIWGPLNEELIVGHVVLRLFPPAKISTLPGDY